MDGVFCRRMLLLHVVCLCSVIIASPVILEQAIHAKNRAGVGSSRRCNCAQLDNFIISCDEMCTGEFPRETHGEFPRDTLAFQQCLEKCATAYLHCKPLC